MPKKYYLGGMVFNRHDGQNDVELSYALTPQGMIDTAGGKQNYHYYLTDQLGSVRVVFRDLDGNGRVDIHGATSEACLASGKACLASGEVLQVNNFYPYGMQHVDWDISDDNPYMFQPKRSGDPGLVPGGKEMKEHTLSGALLAWYDFGARQYDPVLGRWHARDPLAAKFAGMSPYCGMGNNPIMFIDPNGESITLGAILIGAAIGAIVGSFTGASIKAGTAAFWDWKKEDLWWQGAAWGAVFGAASGVAGVALVGAGVAAPGVGMVTGMISGAGNGLIAGGDFESMFTGMVMGGLVGGYLGFATNGLMGAADALVKKIDPQRIHLAWGFADNKNVLDISGAGIYFQKGSNVLHTPFSHTHTRQLIVAAFMTTSEPLSKTYKRQVVIYDGSSVGDMMIVDGGEGTFADWYNSLPIGASTKLTSANVTSSVAGAEINPGNLLNFEFQGKYEDQEIKYESSGAAVGLDVNFSSLSDYVSTRVVYRPYSLGGMVNGFGKRMVQVTRLTFVATW